MERVNQSREVTGLTEREIFLAALDQPSPEDRASFLKRICGADAALRSSVEDLLESAKNETFLATPAIQTSSSTNSFKENGGAFPFESTFEKSGDKIGRYKLLEMIGEGGCGVVYMAQQETPVRRTVALKIIKPGMDSKAVIARFEAERQALALMDHPNIARVFDAGTTDHGRPFFVMELVRGSRITEYCDENHASTRERLELFVKVCQAVQHAHQKGIIHRDIKPSNILVTLRDGQPIPKVIDFGIAKATEQRLTDKTLFTELHAFIGTPAYTSPEQAEMRGVDVDTRTDIYSLGVLLYELLTGKTPFDAREMLASGLDEMRRTIREKEPLPPSSLLARFTDTQVLATARRQQSEAGKLHRVMDGDLDSIVMKALEKDRTRRYATATELAADVERHLAGEPVLARPASRIYRFQKLVRRNRGVFAAVAAVTLALVAGATIGAWQAVRATIAERNAQFATRQEAHLRRQAERERERAIASERLARLNEYVADMNLAHQAILAGNYGRASQLIEKHRPRNGEPDLRGFEWRYLWELAKGDEHVSLPTQAGNVMSLSVSTKGDLVALGTRDKCVILNLQTKALVATIPKSGQSLMFSPDGKWLATSSRSTTRIWRTSDWGEEKSLSDQGAPLAFSNDNQFLAVSSRDGVKIWDTKTWTRAHLLAKASGPLAFSPDSRKLITATSSGLTLWDVESSRRELTLEGTAAGRSGLRESRLVAFSPDGKEVIGARSVGGEHGAFALSVWDPNTGREIGTIPSDPQLSEHTGTISSLTFSPDGQMLVTGSWDHSVRVWNVAARQMIASLHGNFSEVWSVAFTPDGRSVISGAKDGTAKLWPIPRTHGEETANGDWIPLRFSEDAKTLAAFNPKGFLAIFNVATQEPDQQFPVEPNRFPFWGAPSISADLTVFAEPAGDVAKLWHLETTNIASINLPVAHSDFLTLSPDGRNLVSGGWKQPLSWRDLKNPTNPVVVIEGDRAIFSEDNRSLVVFAKQSKIDVWDIGTRSLRKSMAIESSFSSPSALSFDGRLLAIGSDIESYDNVIRLFDLATGQLIGTCTGHKQPARSLAFSPDGRTLASAGSDSTLKFWNVATQQELLSLRRLGKTLSDLHFSPDGRFLVGHNNGRDAGDLYFLHTPALVETDSIQRVSR